MLGVESSFSKTFRKNGKYFKGDAARTNLGEKGNYAESHEFKKNLSVILGSNRTKIPPIMKYNWGHWTRCQILFLICSFKGSLYLRVNVRGWLCPYTVKIDRYKPPSQSARCVYKGVNRDVGLKVYPLVLNIYIK